MAKKKKSKRSSRKFPRGIRLVNAHLEGVSVRTFQTHRAELKASLFQQHGIYALYRRGKLYYVGLAKNLFSRLFQHTHDRHERKWDRFSAYVTRREHQVKELESLALRIMVPQGNRVKGRLRGSADLAPDLVRTILNHHQYSLGELFGGKQAKKARRRASKWETGAGLLKRINGRRRKLVGWLHGREYHAVLLRSGMIRVDDEEFETPLAAARAATGRPLNGWAFWRFRERRGWRKLNSLKRG
jgi:hypothetical protein